MAKAKLFRCRICGDPYIGVNPPNRCPFCGAYEEFIVEAKKFDRTFDVTLNDTDKANVGKAFQIEISNATTTKASSSSKRLRKSRRSMRRYGAKY
jgi:hypothetical protein